MSGQYYSSNSIIQYYLHKLGILQQHFLGQSIIAFQRMQTVNYSASLRIFMHQGYAGVAKSLYFYFLCLLFNVIYSYFFICWLDFFLNIRFSNRSNSILRIKLSLSPHVIWSFSEVRIARFTWNTFLCLNCHFTNFSSLKLYINDLQN